METPQLERRLAAIFAADVQGYSQLMSLDETGTLETLSAFRRITDALIVEWEGRIANTAGDSVLAEFPTVLNAVKCAVAMQAALAAANEPLPQARRMYFRVGINLGDVMVKDADIFGDGVNIAARLEALAEPGGICVSRGVRDGVRGKVPYVFEDVGVRAVKEFAHPIRAYRVRPADPDAAAGEAEPAPAPGGAAAAGEPALPAEDDRALDLAFWDSVKDSDETEEFEAYLQQFPAGRFRSLAESRLEKLRAPPAPGAAAANPDEGVSNVEMAFWDSIKDSKSVADYEAYLAQFPAGSFAGLARARIDAAGAGEPAELELAFWTTIQHSENPRDFAEYLKQFPQGTFAGLARSRIDGPRGR